MPQSSFPHANWRTSSYTGEQGACVELASLASTVAVRDTKNRPGPMIQVERAAFAAFVREAKTGKYDL
ncbi:DUF397 domain-containing protein [Actinomadura harenae]|uniref:DUF397 domain-containing protein n=1 Tax=Actinomadura harenae TaxID=2483351 RepID=A0A3M2M7Y4_9ACTN|nr:DUF397 domain-containing protein [Actinomadura harenae]RMI44665.1 DUF397 domain-containing protein [Actinomadura harenae]